MRLIEITDNKKAPDNAGALVREFDRSEASGYRRAVTAEAIIQAHSQHIDVLADPVSRSHHDRIGYLIEFSSLILIPV